MSYEKSDVEPSAFRSRPRGSHQCFGFAGRGRRRGVTFLFFAKQAVVKSIAASVCFQIQYLGNA